jgi:uncharacterized protein (UPF0261 family)
LSVACNPWQGNGTNPERDAAFIRSIKSNLRSPMRVREGDARINDPVVAEAAIAGLIRLMADG